MNIPYIVEQHCDVCKDVLMKTKKFFPMVVCFSDEGLIASKMLHFDDSNKKKVIFDAGREIATTVIGISKYIIISCDAAMKSYQSKPGYTEMPLLYPESMRDECILNFVMRVKDPVFFSVIDVYNNKPDPVFKDRICEEMGRDQIINSDIPRSFVAGLMDWK